jgi:hypothetical protein
VSEGRASISTLRGVSKTIVGEAEPPVINTLDATLEKVQDITLATVKGIGKLTKASLTTPLYFSMGIARGFQNIPIAYNDTTVRRPDRVDGIYTGFEVAMSVRLFWHFKVHYKETDMCGSNLHMASTTGYLVW